MTWEIPAPGHTCPTCGHDVSAHTGPCVMVETLKEALGAGHGIAEATMDGVTIRVTQYRHIFTEQLFWCWESEVTYDRGYMESELAGEGYDPEALIWQRCDE